MRGEPLDGWAVTNGEDRREPAIRSTNHLTSIEGNKIEMDTEQWFFEGNTRFRWVVGTNWLGAMGGTAA